jgi:hypothetical protein
VYAFGEEILPRLKSLFGDKARKLILDRRMQTHAFFDESGKVRQLSSLGIGDIFSAAKAKLVVGIVDLFLKLWAESGFIARSPRQARMEMEIVVYTSPKDVDTLDHYITFRDWPSEPFISMKCCIISFCRSPRPFVIRSTRRFSSHLASERWITNWTLIKGLDMRGWEMGINFIQSWSCHKT